jgi:hypothetical protein
MIQKAIEIRDRNAENRTNIFRFQAGRLQDQFKSFLSEEWFETVKFTIK